MSFKYRVDSIEELTQMWLEDSKITHNLGDSAMKVAAAHGKYLAIMTWYRAKVKQYQTELNALKFAKRDWLKGTMPLEELRTRGWEPWPQKLLNDDIAAKIEIDPEVVIAQGKLDFCTEIVKCCEAIILGNKQQGYLLRTAMDYNKFTSGN